MWTAFKSMWPFKWNMVRSLLKCLQDRGISYVKIQVRYSHWWWFLVLTHLWGVPLIIQSVDYQRHICPQHSTCFSCCRWSVSARGIMEGLPWAHWKGSWQDDKASISLQLSSKVKCSLNLIAPEKKIQILPCAAEENSNHPADFPPLCGFHKNKAAPRD